MHRLMYNENRTYVCTWDKRTVDRGDRLLVKKDKNQRMMRIKHIML